MVKRELNTRHVCDRVFLHFLVLQDCRCRIARHSESTWSEIFQALRMFAIPTSFPSTANARQQQFWEMLEEDFEETLSRLSSCSLIDFEHE